MSETDQSNQDGNGHAIAKGINDGINEVADKVADLGRDIGEYIKQQRSNAKISLRQLSRLAGVSNPYLSQIERGLRKPSAEILQQIAKALRISAEALYVQAGILEQRAGAGPVVDAVLADDGLTERQKQALLEVYDSFRRENATTTTTTQDDESVVVSVVTAAGNTEEAAAASASTDPVPRAPRKRASRIRTAAQTAPTQP
jgi:transcriptional regulator with XRE-family HTH domain